MEEQLEVQFFTPEILEKIRREMKSDPNPPPQQPPLKINGTLNPYTGEWNFGTAKHLLFRAMYGPKKSEIDNAVSLGLDATIDELLKEGVTLDPPINYNFPTDIFVPIGSTWVDAPSPQGTGNYRRRSLRAWITGSILSEGISVHEKMIMFWHNHFVVANIQQEKFEYQYWLLLRENALGNFKSFAKKMTTNPAMLVYLNGNQNTKQAPNENYARELLELFTVGKGDLAGPGDYTTFTETDVAAAAKILTGWKINYNFALGALPEPVYLNFLHDTTTKTLSNRFGNANIPNNGENEFEDLIDIIFQSEEAAKFMARKLYRWFVYYHIDETIEQNIIEPLAQVLIDNDYEIKPALKALFSSEHFYDVNSIGCQIKSPIDFISANVKQFDINFDAPITVQYGLWYGIFQAYGILQQVVFDIPLVAGWTAYYQSPTFNRIWINSFTLPVRRQYSDVITTIGFAIGGRPFVIDAFAAIADLPDPLDPNKMIKDLASHIFSMPLLDAQVDFLKEVLIPGLPDDEWTIEYNAYLVDPENVIIKAAVEIKLRLMMRTMLSMAEYHLQ